jgi:hypothetical protein
MVGVVFHRVAGPHCWGPALSEPDVTVSRHPAQALRTPLSGRRGGEIKSHHLHDTHLESANVAVGGPPTMACHSAASLETAPMAVAIVICFAPFADLPRSLV